MLEVLEISCRKNDGWLGELSVGPLRFSTAGAVITVADFLERCRGKRVLVFAHGYHNKEAQADKTIATVESLVEAAELPYDVLVLFSWSGGLTYAGFGLAVARTKTCGSSLSDALRLIDGVNAHVDLCSHSLGAGVVAEALLLLECYTCRGQGWMMHQDGEQCPACTPKDGSQLGGTGMLELGNWIILAGAIPDNSLGDRERFDVAKLGVSRVLVIWSRRDEVLRTAYRIGSFFKTAIGMSGPAGEWDSHRITSINATQWVGGHSEAYSAPEVYHYWNSFKAGII